MIKNITIRNYKSIRDLTLPLGRVNVLIGENGAGKSNFISFFEMVHALYHQRLGHYSLVHGGGYRFLYEGEYGDPYVEGSIDFDHEVAFFFRLVPSVSNKLLIEESRILTGYLGGEDHDRLKHWQENIMVDSSVEESALLRFRHGSNADEILQQHMADFTVFHFHDTGITAAMRRPSPLRDNDRLRSDGSNLAGFLFMLQEKYPDTLEMIEGVTRSIAPYFGRFKLTPDRLTPDTVTLKWEEEGSSCYLDGYSFSDGTLRFIALATLLLQPRLPATIFIDEPELGLHPVAINLLGSLISRASLDSQIILATQSATLLNCFEPDEVITVDRRDRQSVFRRLNGEELVHWLQEYSLGDIWTKNIIGGQI